MPFVPATCTPELSYLRAIACATNNLIAEDRINCAIVSLPKLRSFNFTGSAYENTLPYVYKDIMDHLQFRSSTQLILEMNEQPGHPSEFDYLVPAMRLLFQDNPPTRLDLNHVDTDRFDLKFSSHMPPETFWMDGPQDAAAMRQRAEFRRLRSSRRFVPAFQMRLVLHAELAHIVEFSVPMDEFDLEGLTCILRALPKLHTLHLRSGERLKEADDKPVGCLSALVASASITSSSVDVAKDLSHASTVVLPRLRHLALGIESLSTLKRLASAVERRAQLHAPVLRTLALNFVDEPGKMEEGYEDAVMLCELVENLLWRRGGGTDHIS